MKWTILIALAALLVAGVALADNPMSKTLPIAEDKPFDYPERDYFEGFEDGLMPPTGWNQTINCVTDSVTTWDLGSAGPYPDPYEGSEGAYIHWQAGACSQDEWLTFDYTLTDENTLTFATMGSTYWAMNADFLVTINGTVVWSFYNDFTGTDWTYEVIEIDLSGYTGTIEVGFGYVGADGADHYLDAVNILYQEPEAPPCCPFEYDCYVFDFNESACGLELIECDGLPTWQWGAPDPAVPTTACDGVPVTNVLGTTLVGAYPAGAGEIAMVGPAMITPDCTCLELCHFYNTESEFTPWDGGNVKISTDGGATWTLIYPQGEIGYPGLFPDCGGTYFPPCVCGEEGFYGDSISFVRDCFDISDFVGQEVWIGFCFGSDSYATDDLGWYIKWAKIGGAGSATEDSSWGNIKAMYR
jgi:hypothetical protein